MSPRATLSLLRAPAPVPRRRAATTSSPTTSRRSPGRCSPTGSCSRPTRTLQGADARAVVAGRARLGAGPDRRGSCVLTRQGWARPRRGAAVTFLAARLFGIVELFIVGAGARDPRGRRGGLRPRGAAAAARAPHADTRRGSTPATPPGSRWRPPTSATGRTPVLTPARPGRRDARRPAAPRAAPPAERGTGRLPTADRSTRRRGRSGRSPSRSTDPFGVARHKRAGAPRARADGVPPRRRDRGAARRRRPRPARHGGAPPQHRPPGRRLLRAAAVRGRRRPAPGALARRRRATTS